MGLGLTFEIAPSLVIWGIIVLSAVLLDGLLSEGMVFG